MKYIVSFLIVVLAFSFCMAIARDYTFCKQHEIGIALKVEPPAKPAQYQPPVKPVTYQPPARPVQPPVAVASEIPDSFTESDKESDNSDDLWSEYYDEYEPEPSQPKSLHHSDNLIVQEIMNTFGHEWKLALAIARAESNLNPRAVNQNRNGTRDIGIFQINDSHGWSETERYDWQNNIAMAKEIRDRYGWSAWSVYKSGQFRQFM